MRTGWPVALATLALSASVGCSVETTTTSTSEDDYTGASGGLWALEGDAEHGDIELLQLTPTNYASLVRAPSPASALEAGPPDAPEAEGAPAADGPAAYEATSRSPAAAVDTHAAMGDVSRDALAPSLTAAERTYAVQAEGDTLTLTRADGHVLTYRRSYRLYCVPTDRSVEATVLIDLGKEPKVIGVNGDGRTFPSAGEHDATVRTDVLFRLHDYVVTSRVGTSFVTVKLPWTAMSEPEIAGTLAIVGPPDATQPTPITCERFASP